MSDTNFIAHQTLVRASWLNDINNFFYHTFQAAPDATSARIAIDAVSATEVASVYETQAHATATFATITDVALKAPLADPALTGNATTAVTPALHDFSTKIANTEFVFNEVQDAVISGLPTLSYVFAYASTLTWIFPTSGAIPLDSKLVDTLSEYNTATAVFTPIADGNYQFSLRSFVSGAGPFTVRIIMAGSSAFDFVLAFCPNGGEALDGIVIIPMQVGDTATVTGTSSAGGVAGGVSSGSITSNLCIKRVL